MSKVLKGKKNTAELRLHYVYKFWQCNQILYCDSMAVIWELCPILALDVSCCSNWIVSWPLLGS